MRLRIEPNGTVHAIYGEELPLESLGRPCIERASHVEPEATGGWSANLRPVGGPVLTGFARRSEALAAEIEWLDRHWLQGPKL
jgi:hypothetical protein